MNRIFSLLLLLTMAILPADGRYTFKHLDMNNGLSHNTVTSILRDKKGFMWFGTTDGLNRFDGRAFRIYSCDNSTHSIGSNDVKSLYEAEDGCIWVGTDRGIHIYSPQTDAFQPFMDETSDGKRINSPVTLIREHKGVIYIVVDRQGLFRYDKGTKRLDCIVSDGYPTVTDLGFDGHNRVWIGFYGAGLHYTDDNFRKLSRFTDENGKDPFAQSSIYGIIPAGNGRLFVGSDKNGLVEISAGTRTVRTIVDEVNGKHIYVHSLLCKEREIWAATELGLYIYNMDSRQLDHYCYEPSNPFSLSDNPLQCLYQDADQGIWVGSYFGGINYSPYEHSPFEKFLPRIDQNNSLRGRRVRGLKEDNYGNIWLGTEDNGLNCYNPRTGTFRFVEESLAWPNVHCLCLDGDMLWVGTFSYGIRLVDIRTGKPQKAFLADGHPGSLPDNAVFSICKCADGTVYVGTLSGLCHYDRETGQFVEEDSVHGMLVNDIYEDNRHDLWVATQGQGVYVRRSATRKWEQYATGKKKNVASDKVLSIFEDRNGKVWVTTQDRGVAHYDAKSDKFVTVPIPRYLPEHFVFQIVEDDSGMFWLTTNNGLISYNPASGDAVVYTTSHGLLDNQFNYKSSILSNNGKIYMGSINGFVAFNPASFEENDAVPNIVATDLFINNVTTDIYTPGTPLKKSIAESSSITLRHNENSFSLRVVAPAFNSPWLNQMEYKLEGFDSKWQHLFGDNLITYTNLSPGHYTLMVRVKLSNGKWSPNVYKLDITVKPPLYLTWWALLCYMLIVLGAAFYTYRHWHQRSVMKRKLAMEKFEHEKEQELYQSKINFFTNVAHEIRTPLTLIKGPLENILQKDGHDEEEREDLDIMEKNVSRLLDLTNQLLDFRKTERNGMRLNFVKANLVKVINDVYIRFTPLMRNKGIESRFDAPETPPYAFIDREGFTKIISNLMTNAVKYCDHIINISLTVDGNNFQVRFCNDGKIISQAAREKIFTPFFRLEENTPSTTGTGLGLALSRTLAELHGGTLTMDNSETDLNAFVLTLPINQQPTLNLADEGPAAIEQPDWRNEDEDGKHYTVLVVEDNVPMLNYEKKALQKNYHVLTATNGLQALEILAESDVNIIISDVMMEPMNGFELCRQVKQDVNISHIPFIMLTALTLDSAKVEGMESGADLYIEKPFSVDYLSSAIQNLLRNRENIKSAFANSPFIKSGTLSISKTDDEFLERLESVVARNLADNQFDIGRLAQEMCMSKTKLNRKIKGLLNMSPNNYIKIERLKQAATLLKEGNGKISEVCYIVGFSSPSYFSQCFYKQFGLLPKDFTGKTDNMPPESASTTKKDEIMPD